MSEFKIGAVVYFKLFGEISGIEGIDLFNIAPNPVFSGKIYRNPVKLPQIPSESIHTRAGEVLEKIGGGDDY